MASSYDGVVTSDDEVVAVRSPAGTKAATAEAKHARESKRIMIQLILSKLQSGLKVWIYAR